MGVRPRLVCRAAHSQSVHVAFEVELLDGGEPVVVRPGPGRRVEQHVVDVGDVATDLDLNPEPPQHPLRSIHPHEGRGVAEVRHVVRRDPTDVDPSPADDRQRLVAEMQSRRDRRVGHCRSCR